MSPKADSVKDRHHFKPILAEIEERPVSPLGRATFWILLLLGILTIGWLCIGTVDVVVSARGKVIPEGEVKTLQPLETGVVRQILVKEGDHVVKGQVLMEIDPSTTEPELAAYQENLSQLELEANRLRSSAMGAGFSGGSGGVDPKVRQAEKALFQASSQNLNKKLEAQEASLKNIQARIEANRVTQQQQQAFLKTAQEREERLRPVQDILPKDDYQKVLDEIQTYQSKLKELAYEQDGLTHQGEQIQQEMATTRSGFQADALKELVERQKQLSELNARVQQTTFRKKRQQIMAPQDGTIDKLFIHTVGGVVTPAEKLLTLVPANTRLIVDATALNQDIGFVRPAMPVQIKVDAFDFQKYGMLAGSVLQISSDSREDGKNQGSVYALKILPRQTQLRVDGQWTPISPGMSVTSEIRVGQRRIIEFFIYPLIKHLHEGMSVR